jgi:hypothetical protein
MECRLTSFVSLGSGPCYTRRRWNFTQKTLRAPGRMAFWMLLKPLLPQGMD